MSATDTERPDAIGDCRDALAMLDKIEDVHPGTPATPANVERAESLLGFELPPSLRFFVTEIGSLTVCGREVLGLYADEVAPDVAADIVGATLLERSLGLPDHCIVVANPGNGTRVIVDMDDGGLVRVWTPRSGERGYETYPHFGRYLLEVVSDAEGDEKMARFKERRRAQLERLKNGGG